MNRRKEIKLVGDKRYYLKSFITIFCLVGVTGFMVILINIAAVERSALVSAPFLLQKMILYSILALFIILTCSILIAFFYMKKVGEPMHGLQKKVNTMLKDNEYQPIRFRRDDEFQSLGEAVNRLIEQLFIRNKKGAALALKTAEDVKNYIASSSDKEELKNYLIKLEETLYEIFTVLKN